MPENVEIKAKIDDSESLALALRRLGASQLETLYQEDTFFGVPKGRLKMRCDDLGQCELVYYRRPNDPAPCISAYYRQPLQDAEGARQELEMLFGIKGVVRKNRIVFLKNGVRIHIDDVEGIGMFLEIEVPLERRRDVTRARATARDLMVKLDITEDRLIGVAYEDLIPKGAPQIDS